jgi:fused signal recognition particle receptor
VDATTLWLIVGVILLVAASLVGFVAVGRRRALRTGESPPSVESAPRGWEKSAEDSGDAPSATQVDVRATPPDVALPEVELPEVPEFERPEAPESRLVRLRRRLAGSNSPLSRGLLLLITRDRIDEDTWEEFEETLITSDLGVAPTTELVESLRNKLRVEGVTEPGRAKAILRAELIKLVDPTMDRSLNADRPSSWWSG